MRRVRYMARRQLRNRLALANRFVRRGKLFPKGREVQPAKLPLNRWAAKFREWSSVPRELFPLRRAGSDKRRARGNFLDCFRICIGDVVEQRLNSHGVIIRRE